MKRASILLLTIIIGVSLFTPIFAQNVGTVPGNMSEVESRANTLLNAIPAVLRGLWHELVGYFWTFMNWLAYVFNKYVKTPAVNFWNREIIVKKPSVEQEFQKEKQEMKQDIKTEVPVIGKSLWNKFMDLIR